MNRFLFKAALSVLLACLGCRGTPPEPRRLSVGLVEETAALAGAAEHLAGVEVKHLRREELPEALAVGAVDVVIMPLSALLAASLTYPNLEMVYPYCAKRDLYTLLSKGITPLAEQRIVNPSEAEAESSFAAQFGGKKIAAESSAAEEALFTFIRDRGFNLLQSLTTEVLPRNEAIDRVREDKADGAVVLRLQESGVQIHEAAALGRTEIYGFVASEWTIINRKKEVLRLVATLIESDASGEKPGSFQCPASLAAAEEAFISPSGEYYWRRAAEQSAAFIKFKSKDERLELPLDGLFRGVEMQEELRRFAGSRG